MPHIFETLINGFIDDKIGIAENFIEPALASALRSNLVRLHASEQLYAAGTGNKTIDHRRKNRGDLIHWMDPASRDAAENIFFNRIDAFVEYLNRTCYTGISQYEFHYTLYQRGSYYKRHKDQFRDDNSRQYSMILYLNKDWQQIDGGQLCIYPHTTGQMIDPLNGKLVFFKSAEMEHEVLVTNKERMSITGWLKV